MHQTDPSYLVVPNRSDIQRQHYSTTNTGRVRPPTSPPIAEQSRAWPTYMALGYLTTLLPTISTHPPSRSPHRNSLDPAQHHGSNQYRRRRRSCPRPFFLDVSHKRRCHFRTQSRPLSKLAGSEKVSFLCFGTHHLYLF